MLQQLICFYPFFLPVPTARLSYRMFPPPPQTDTAASFFSSCFCEGVKFGLTSIRLLFPRPLYSWRLIRIGSLGNARLPSLPLMIVLNINDLPLRSFGSVFCTFNFRGRSSFDNLFTPPTPGNRQRVPPPPPSHPNTHDLRKYRPLTKKKKTNPQKTISITTILNVFLFQTRARVCLLSLCFVSSLNSSIDSTGTVPTPVSSYFSSAV